MDRDVTPVSGKVGFFTVMHEHIQNYLSAARKRDINTMIAAVDALEDLMAHYYTDDYRDAADGLADKWDELQEDMEKHGQVEQMDKSEAYRVLRERFRYLICLAGERGLLPGGSKPPERDV